MKKNKEYKIFMIYCFEYFEENDAKLFDEIVSQQMCYPRKFKNYTEEENKKYLAEWKRKNNIKLCDFELLKTPRYNKYGTPIFIKRVNGTYTPCGFDEEV